MRIKQQSGFTPVEVVVVVLVVVSIAAAGFLVLRKHTPAKTANNSNRSSQNSNSSTKQKNPYFTINQWNVRAPYSGNVTLEYEVASGFSDGDRMFVGSTELGNADTACAISTASGIFTGPVGYIGRYLPNDVVPTSDGTIETARDLINQNATGQASVIYGKAGDYYYIYWPSTASCSSNATAQKVQQQTIDTFKQLTPNLQTVTN